MKSKHADNLFMVPEIIPSQQWVQLDGSEGIMYIPSDCWEGGRINTQREYGLLLPETWYPTNLLDVLTEAGRFKAGKYEVEFVEGFGYRLSAPGYLDCTSWKVVPTYKEAYNGCIEDFEQDGEIGRYMRENFTSPTAYAKQHRGKKGKV